jgi:hypothetical protein
MPSRANPVCDSEQSLRSEESLLVPRVPAVSSRTRRSICLLSPFDV